MTEHGEHTLDTSAQSVEVQAKAAPDVFAIFTIYGN